MLGIIALAAAATTPANDYGLEQNWLCRPDRRDACSTPNLDVTDIAADGTMTPRPFVRAVAPKADCFYVYPTLSLDPGGNSDMIANDEERSVVLTQFARFGAQCRTFAPLYRQSTLSWLRSNLTGKPLPVDMELRYTDVRDAWRHYLKADNQGRPYVLIGHSQGSGLLKRLIAEEIEGKPEQGRMLSAMLAGHNVVVAKGSDTGGDFKAIPLCKAKSQIGCVLAWTSFRDTAPPPENSRYGKAPSETQEIACTNPGSLKGGSGELHAVFPVRSVAASMTGEAIAWTASGAPIATALVGLPSLYRGSCVRAEGVNYFAVKLSPAKPGGRVADPGGDIRFGPNIARDWGLHLIDMNLVLDDLVDLVGSQQRAWEASASVAR